jgi:hypothetical protein
VGFEERGRALARSLYAAGVVPGVEASVANRTSAQKRCR